MLQAFEEPLKSQDQDTSLAAKTKKIKHYYSGSSSHENHASFQVFIFFRKNKVLETLEADWEELVYDGWTIPNPSASATVYKTT